jgi:hypothetical protein
MNSQVDTEALADVQHEIWSHWMRYLFSVCTANEDGSYTIPAGKVQHWQRQMATPYHELPEAEKESDREQAAKVLKLLIE